jgi:hypothetical protein
MSKFTRRQLLTFFGASAGAAVLAPVIGEKRFGSSIGMAEAAESVVTFTPVRLPHPLPMYQLLPSYMRTPNNQEFTFQPSINTRLPGYEIVDDVVVPPEYERYVLVRWGDRVFPNSEDYFGYNCDFTSFIPLDNNPNPLEGILWVNHEYISYPFSTLVPEAPSDVAGFPTSYPLVIGRPLPATRTIEVDGEFMYNMGGSIVTITRRGNPNGRFAVVRGNSLNRRIHGLSGLGINAQRTDAYRAVTAWGPRSYQQGDQNYLIGTGSAATQVFPLSSDGLGNRIIGTAFNCSGGTTPWGTVLSAEENFQGSSGFFVGVTEPVSPNGTQTSYTAGTTGATFGLVGEKYGWMVEVDPANPSLRPRKHTALGRFRHENIAFRVEAGQRLVAYMGDDRRGGHTWKFVSSGIVSSPTNKSNSSLLENGTLYVARYNPDGTGEWIPLLLTSPTNPIPPSVLASVEIAATGSATRNGRLPLPSRLGIAGQTANGGLFNVETTNQATALPGYTNKTLANFYTSQGAVLCDAFLAANLIGGTPTARPEDIEVHPTTKAVYIAYTDGAPGGDGYPDSRIFVVSKYSRAVNAAQPSGELFKIIENSPDGTGTTFRWQRLAKGGEAGAQPGSGFANVDNLAFDNQGNVWGVTDMSTSAHNGFDVGAAARLKSIDHTVIGATPEPIGTNLNVETSSLIGVFGNNWMFCIPMSGAYAGQIVPFAYGPPRCEFTGPTFVGDTLILSVQHPGEDCPFAPQVTLSRTIEMLDLNGTLFNQIRNVPRGSNWPSNIEGNPGGPPRPSVVLIKRKKSFGGTFL